MSDKPTVGRIVFSPSLDDAAKASREMGLVGCGDGMGTRVVSTASLQAENAALRAEVEELTEKVRLLRQDNSAWIAANCPGGWVDALRIGHDRYEWLRRQNLPSVIGLWRAAMMHGARFDDLVDEIRASGPRDEVRK